MPATVMQAVVRPARPAAPAAPAPTLPSASAPVSPGLVSSACEAVPSDSSNASGSGSGGGGSGASPSTNMTLPASWTAPSSLARFLRSTPWLPAVQYAPQPDGTVLGGRDEAGGDGQGGLERHGWASGAQQGGGGGRGSSRLPEQQRDLPVLQRAGAGQCCLLMMPSQLWLPEPSAVEVLGEGVPYLQLACTRGRVRKGTGGATGGGGAGGCGGCEWWRCWRLW